ncbi:hypothetical protein HMPREF9080_00942 [Cardiobacterium valvarum F0432]|uniref:Uncharacterized protein n=1 Tax=Cardiobacterium valvarum F0432 TaxID=797473 RepID=G9ZDV8_9GAMM|nr:hypothetical protein HMPREF9080_00942 [Cardiobacterium valvarum F0432]
MPFSKILSCTKPTAKHSSHPCLSPVVSPRLVGIFVAKKKAREPDTGAQKVKQRRLPLRNLLT